MCDHAPALHDHISDCSTVLMKVSKEYLATTHLSSTAARLRAGARTTYITGTLLPVCNTELLFAAAPWLRAKEAGRFDMNAVYFVSGSVS